jgi:hypothetical protein
MCFQKVRNLLMILCADVNTIFTDAVVESLDALDRLLSFRGDLLSQTLNAQPQPSAFESCTSSDICSMTETALSLVQSLVLTDYYSY